MRLTQHLAFSGFQNQASRGWLAKAGGKLVWPTLQLAPSLGSYPLCHPATQKHPHSSLLPTQNPSSAGHYGTVTSEPGEPQLSHSERDGSQDMTGAQERLLPPRVRS